MQQQNLKGLKRLIGASFNSWNGLVAAWTHEEAFRQELELVVVAAPLAFLLGNTWLETRRVHFVHRLKWCVKRTLLATSGKRAADCDSGIAQHRHRGGG